MRIFALIFLLAVVAGCRHPANNAQQFKPLAPDFFVYETPTNLANEIANADRIIVTDVIVHGESQYPRGFILSGDKVREVTKAISSGRLIYKKSSPLILRIQWEYKLQFYESTNYLASVWFDGDVFLTDDESTYHDESGVLKKLYDEVLERTEAPQYR